MKNKFRIAAAVFTAVLALSGVTAFAQSNETTVNTETVIEDNRTLTPQGNADLIDNVSDNENLQFITVTARDGNVFYFVIDKGATSNNVYFLNTVDESDLAALVEGTEINTKIENPPSAAETLQPDTEPAQKTDTEQEPAGTKNADKDKTGNNGFLLILLALIGVAGVGAYYFKIVLPKKKLEQADDIEDFEFEGYDEDDEETEPDNEDEEYSDDIKNE